MYGIGMQVCRYTYVYSARSRIVLASIMVYVRPEPGMTPQHVNARDNDAAQTWTCCLEMHRHGHVLAKGQAAVISCRVSFLVGSTSPARNFVSSFTSFFYGGSKSAVRSCPASFLVGSRSAARKCPVSFSLLLLLYCPRAAHGRGPDPHTQPAALHAHPFFAASCGPLRCHLRVQGLRWEALAPAHSRIPAVRHCGWLCCGGWIC